MSLYGIIRRELVNSSLPRGCFTALGGSLNWVSVGLCKRWRHQMETFSVLLASCGGDSPVIPVQRPVTRRFDVFFDLCLNKLMINEAGDLRRHRAHYDVLVMISGWRAHNDRSAVEFVLWIIWRLRIADVQTWFNFRHKPYYYVRNVVCIREKELPRKVFWGLRELLSNTAQNGNQHAGSTVQCRYNTVQYSIPIHHDITNYAVQRATENSPAIGLIKYIPYLALTGGLWCALFKESVEKWPYYNGFAL